ncbi:MAG: phosphotransferase [Dokdonella sp.]|uniref:phosphotransferase enzyme family protein n=1 Tax=Dokdonella sp. TaxID=2291710 RepID=UPI0025BBD6C8|nr:phosphotransferase [Dokdonella sp.]MBX3699597.1 phosphotransferase [Dokdonella sp.]MCW5577758.1 phosphotransferase [Dokdonella sp.]
MSGAGNRVHGLAGDSDMAEPDWPPLNAGELVPLLARYPALGALRAIVWHSPRPLSAAALVDCAGGRVFVKRHHRSVRDAASLGEEHAFAAWLRTHGMPIPPLHRDCDGQETVALGDWVYVVQEPAAGLDLYRDTRSWLPLTRPAHASCVGATLARLHAAATGFVAPQRSTHVLVARSELIEAADPVAALAAQLPARPGLARFLAARDWRRELTVTLAPFHARLQPALVCQPRAWTHGDFYASNLFWSTAGDAAQVTAVVDFGLCARTFALFDLATAIERSAIAWLQAGEDRARNAIALALVAGYRSLRPLGAQDLAVLADLLPLVHVDFALSEVEYFDAITRNRANAELAWSAFLHGHARWFTTPHGRAMLDALRAA